MPLLTILRQDIVTCPHKPALTNLSDWLYSTPGTYQFYPKTSSSLFPEKLDSNPCGHRVPPTLQLSIIIVSYQARHFVSKTLTSIQKYPPPVPYEILVVDNASRDGTPQMIGEKFPSVGLWVLNQNWGPAVARNFAFQFVRGRFVAFIDSDIEITPSAFSTVLSFLQAHPQAAGAVTRAQTQEGYPLRTVLSFPTPWLWLLELFLPHAWIKTLLLKTKGSKTNLSSLPTPEPLAWPYPIEYSWTAFTFMRKETLEKIGLLDERYFFYCEDLDFFQRLHQSGLQVYLVPQAVCIHYISQSSYQNVRERYKFRFYQLQGKLIYACKYWTQTAFRLFQGLVFVKIGLTWCGEYLLGLFHGTRSSSGNPTQRYPLSLLLRVFDPSHRAK